MVGRVSLPTPDQVEQAVAAAAGVAAEAAALPAHVRAAALTHLSTRVAERADEIAALITAENGKPVKWAALEVSRAVSTLRWSAEEARRFGGELQRLDTDPTATGRLALVRRFPRGPVLGIAPFNFPLNLVVHKLGPALAVGAPIVVKPAPATPLSALLLGELVAETELPAGMVVGAAGAQRPGRPSWSTTRGCRWCPSPAPARSAGRSRSGCRASTWCSSSAATARSVVAADYPDLDWAASRIATFSNYQAGQSCIAVQRVYVERPAYEPLVREAGRRGRALARRPAEGPTSAR